MGKRKGGRPSRKDAIPLQVVIDRFRGRRPTRGSFDEVIQPLPGPLHLELWFPGDPIPKKQGQAAATKFGRAYIREDRDGHQHEEKIRAQFIDQIEHLYPHLIPYLPVVHGDVRVNVYSLLDPPGNWFPGRAHTKAPDYDDLAKAITDAHANRRRGWHPLLYWDDCVITFGISGKWFWDQECTLPHYPKEPGALMAVTLLPEPKPSGHLTCSGCGRRFKNPWALTKHRQECSI